MIYRQQKTPILVKGIQLHWGREHANGIQNFIGILVPQDLAFFRSISTESGSYSLRWLDILIHTKSIIQESRKQNVVLLFIWNINEILGNINEST
jgi:hypothetical protein